MPEPGERAHGVEAEARAEPPSVAAPLATSPDEVSRRDASGRLAPYAKAKRAAMMSFDRAYWRELDAETQGNVSEMARRSGMQRHHVRTHLKRLGIRETGEG